jgi:NAD(P)-dependent dehydrogenase (short-subunit alcohol dehydrogenase family)
MKGSTRIEGSVALVTGANRGIGRAITDALLERGAEKVYATARDPETLEGLKHRYGSRVVPLRLDVTRADQVAEVARQAPDVDLLFNNAGVAEWPPRERLEGALHSLTQASRALLAARGVAVFGVYAGPVDTDMNKGMAFEKTSPQDAAQGILDGIEAGDDDIFPDPFAAAFGEQFHSSPKRSERQMAAMAG